MDTEVIRKLQATLIKIDGKLGGRPKITMLSDDGQGNQLWQIGQSLANVRRYDDGQIEITTDCDGWNPDGMTYRKATEKQINQLKTKLATQ